MKKIYIILTVMLSISTWSFSQNVDDALRYSQVFYYGTARFTSMGSAFTALGGDISTLSQNPAGIGIFRSSEITITPQLFYINTISNFKSNSAEDYIYDFNLSQAGVVINLINKNSESGLVTLNVGYSFNKTNNFNQSILIEGIGDKSSMADYWSEISEGFYSDELESYVPDAFLGWKTWVIDTLPGYFDLYGTVYSNYGEDPESTYDQRIKRFISHKGYTGEHAFSVGGNWSNKLYFGATVGLTRLNYAYHYEHMESTDYDLASRFSSFNYSYYCDNVGTGYTFKLGTIYKPIEILRIGFSFHSPTFFRISETISDNISSYFSDVTLPYEASNSAQGFDYALTTPFRITLGAALQVKKIALLSAEYEYVDYRTARFSETGDNYNYSIKNQEIKNSLKSGNNLRLGAEVRLNKIYLRGGYSLYGTAWKGQDLNDGLDYDAVSLGIGFREQNVSLDFGFSRLTNPVNYILYDSLLETAMSDMSVARNIFNVTFGYKFNY